MDHRALASLNQLLQLTAAALPAKPVTDPIAEPKPWTATGQRRQPSETVAIAPRRAVPPIPSIPPAEQSIEERVDWILTGAGFPPMLVEHGRVVLSGFVVTPEYDGGARIHWIGCRAVNSLPYRRTFLSVYAPLLRQSGLTVSEADPDGVPYLICRNTPSTS